MSKAVENKLVPELRFPVFESFGSWIYKNGDKLFDAISNKNHNSDLPILAITQDQGAIPRELIDYSVIVTERSVESYKVVEKGDFIISLRSFQGGIEYSNFKGICSPAYIILRKKYKKDIDLFYKYFFKTSSFIQDLKKNLEGIRDGKMVSFKQFSELLIPSPEPKEQQKIADCLSSLDDLITAESQKLESLKEHKKGLLQKLFPAEGKSVPELRFTEFENSRRWDNKPLGTISEVINKKAGNKRFTLLSIDSGEGLVTQIEKFGKEIAGASYRNYIVINKEDFAYNKSSTKLYPEGQIAMLENYEVGAVPNSIFTCFRVDKNQILPTFLKYLFESNIHGKWLRKYISVGARSHGSLNVNNEDLFSLPIFFPKKQEQQKIINCLTSLDKFISSNSNKVVALKALKIGLMQQLFPSINNSVNG